MIDIYHSRRDKFKKCFLYDKHEGDLDTYVTNAEPIAMFYAREGTTRQQRAQDIQGAFYINKEFTTLETVDEIEVFEGNIIVYMGKAWVVDSVSQQIHQKESEFSGDKNHYITYINVRR